MYKYKAKLIVNQEIIATANSLEDIEAAVLLDTVVNKKLATILAVMKK